MADFHAAYDRFEFEIKGLFSVGDDRVLAQVILSAEGLRSGARLAGDPYGCFWLRNERLFREEDHLTVAGALRSLGLDGDSLEAPGLREEPASTERRVVEAMSQRNAEILLAVSRTASSGATVEERESFLRTGNRRRRAPAAGLSSRWRRA